MFHVPFGLGVDLHGMRSIERSGAAPEPLSNDSTTSDLKSKVQQLVEENTKSPPILRAKAPITRTSIKKTQTYLLKQEISTYPKTSNMFEKHRYAMCVYKTHQQCSKTPCRSFAKQQPTKSAQKACTAAEHEVPKEHQGLRRQLTYKAFSHLQHRTRRNYKFTFRKVHS